MILRIVEASGDLVTEDVELEFDDCKYIRGNILNYAPYRTEEVYHCPDDSVILMKEYYWQEGSGKWRYLVITFTRKFDENKLREALKRVLELIVKEKEFKPDEVRIEILPTDDEIEAKLSEELKKKIIEIVTSL